MWRAWGSNKSTVGIQETTASPFSCSSFKDIQNLCREEPKETSAAAAAAKRTYTVFHRVRIANSLIRSWSPKVQSHDAVEKPHSDSGYSDPPVSIPGADKLIVVYFTSLRVVRSTFEDCSTVRSILRGFRVSIDERDLAMDSRFLDELQGILGQRKLTLPRVFIGGRYIGGAEEVRQMHEGGELKKLIEGLPAAELGTCAVCGGYRFVLCPECNGSHKLYSEKSGFKICTACIENGLIRCPSCSCSSF